MRRKRIRNTIFLLLLLIVLCTAGGFGVYMLKGGDFSTPANSFNAFSEFDNTLTSRVTFSCEIVTVSSMFPYFSASIAVMIFVMLAG